MDIVKRVIEVREQLRARKGDYMKIANETGVSYFWILRFARGTSKNPNIQNVSALDVYFQNCMNQ
jgi:hypothetical protein